MNTTTIRLSARQLVDALEADPMLSTVKPATQTIPWNHALSDHRPIFASIDGFDIVSYNMNNKAYAKWLQPDIDEAGNDQSQRLSQTSFAQMKSSERIEAQVRLVAGWLDAGMIVCAQEVCPEIVDGLKPLYPYGLSVAKSAVNEKGDNFCAIFSLNEINQVRGSECIKVEKEGVVNEDEFGVMVLFHLEDGRETRSIVVANVHVKWGSKGAFAGVMREFADTRMKKVVFCGDFNMSCRRATFGMPTTHVLDAYDDPRFTFLLKEGEPVVSSVNMWENVRSTMLMLDRLDQIIVVE